MPRKIHPWNVKNRPAVGRINCLAELGVRPIHAAPVQYLDEAEDEIEDHPGDGGHQESMGELA